MITTNAAWDAGNAGLGKRPIFLFTIDGAPKAYATHNLTEMGITGTLPEYRPWLRTPQGASQSVDALNCTSTIGELECEVVDRGGELRTLVGTTVLEGGTATLKVGYPGIAIGQFVTLHTNVLYKVTPSRGYTSWLFRSRDRQTAAKRTIYLHPENGEKLTEDNPWVLNGTPAEICQAVYLFGLGRAAAEIDRDAMTALDSAAEGLWHGVRPFQFTLTEPFEAKQFLESEVYKPCGLYPSVNHLGQIALRAARAAAAGPAGAFTFDESNVVGIPDVDRLEIVNEVVYKIDARDSDFGTELMYVEAESLSTYGRGKQHAIESKGLRTELGAQWVCQEMAARLFRRFAGTTDGLRGGAPVLRLESFFLTLPVWPGDLVRVTHGLVPNLADGTLGVDRLYEVIERGPDYAQGRMRYRLLDTGLTAAAGAYGWASCARPLVIGTGTVY